YYGLESNDINDVHEFILKLTYDTIEILKSSQCVVENSDCSYSISFLGTISAEYYISHKSSYKLHTNLDESMSLADVMILFG
ncbi:MAG: activating signal cointegrator 1 complex subunit, partial [Marteilia pararefringens]